MPSPNTHNPNLDHSNYRFRKRDLIKHSSPFSKAHILVVALIFGAIGGYILITSLAAPNPNLQGDLNNDNTVNISDLSILLTNYGTTNTSADINHDNLVNITDLSILLSHYGSNYVPPPSSGMIVGLNHNSGWGLATVADEAGAVKYNRLETSTGSNVSDYYNVGIKTIVLISGTCPSCSYGTNGVSDINPASFASSAVGYYQSQCQSSTNYCPAVEVLNEPGGSWFWGGNAMSQANSAAYANVLIATYNAFHSQFGSASPKILGSYDGGYAGDNTWGQQVYSANSSIGNYVDGWTVHPYGGCGSSTSAQGARGAVSSAHSATNKPIWATEVGWPTATSQPCTGDSSQWTEAQQADNIYNFIQWARSTGYIDGVLIFAYHDYGTNAWYGVVRTDGSKKPSYNALRCAALNLAITCQ